MMTESNAKKQNVLVFYVSTLVYTLIALFLRVVAIAPLACLVLFEMGQWQHWLWLLSPVLLVFLVLPLRCSFAQAMTAQPRCFSFDAAFDFSRYGEKLKGGLLYAVHVIKWGIPMALLMALGYYWYTQVDYLELYQTVDGLGNLCAQVFGLGTANNFMLGLAATAAIFGLGLLIWAWGVARNSASRYLWAIAVRNGCEPKAETSRRLKGRRMEQLGVALVNGLLWVPFVWVTANAVRNAVSDLSTMLMMALTTGAMPKLDLVSLAVPVAFAFAALYLPILPLRRWNTAAFAVRERRVKAEKKAAA